MSWISDYISKAIWKFFADLCSDIINAAFKLIVETIIKTTDPNKYLNVNQYLVYVQVMAGSLLTLAIVWEALKQQSGGAFAVKEKSISVLSLKTVFAGAMIYFLPWSVTHIFSPINNNLMMLIQNIGVQITENKFNSYKSWSDNLVNLGGLMILMGLILAVAFLILAIAGAIRYVELFICILFAPIAAISIINEGEGVQVWVRETVCVVFTQSIHVLLLEMLIKIFSTTTGPMLLILSIGVIAVMLKGPQVLRTFVYSSGVGNASIGAVGSAGRMAAMKYIMKAPIS